MIEKKPLMLQLEAGLHGDRALIGGKASSLLKLLNVGARVPPAFVLTTEAFREWRDEPNGENVRDLVSDGIAKLGVRTGRRLGSSTAPLIVSVRSGAPISMPGMMDTVLNAGMGTLPDGLPAYLYEARARFLLQFAELVCKLEESLVDELRSKYLRGSANCVRTRELETVLRSTAKDRGFQWPSTAVEEIVDSAKAVFESWSSERACLYRRMRGIDDGIGTSVTIQQMVFGNRDNNSGSGVAFSRNPSTGSKGLVGEFLLSGQGEDVVAGRETAFSVEVWAKNQPDLYQNLDSIARTLERESAEVQELEFTVEDGDLYILQARSAKLTTEAAAVIAVAMVEEGLRTPEQAVAYARAHGFDASADQTRKRAVPAGISPWALALPVGGGVASGRMVLTPEYAWELAEQRIPLVFVAEETSPKLLPLMRCSSALVTMRGGATSHAAVVARELGLPCIVGMGGKVERQALEIDGTIIEEGAWITVDGDRGHLYVGDVCTAEVPKSPAAATLGQWAAAHGSQGRRT